MMDWKRVALAVGLVILVGAIPVVAVAATGGATISVVGVKPLEVRGSHFKAREHVKVTAFFAGKRWTKRATANAAGTFIVTYDGGLGLPDPCTTDGIIRVIRPEGTTVTFKMFSERMCPVP